MVVSKYLFVTQTLSQWNIQKHTPEVFCKESVLNNVLSQENTFAGVSFSIKLQVWGLHLYHKSTFITKRTPARGFSCQFCEIFKITFFTEHLWAAASEYRRMTRHFLRENCSQTTISFSVTRKNIAKIKRNKRVNIFLTFFISIQPFSHIYICAYIHMD